MNANFLKIDDDKRGKCHAIIHTATGVAAGASASPIPFSDAAIIVPAQVAMITGLFKVYGK